MKHFKKLIIFSLVTVMFFTLPAHAFAVINTGFNNATKIESDIEFEIQKAISIIDESMSDVEKALVIHDYIILNCEFDTTLTKRSIYNCMVEKKAVCLGYALSYQEIMRRLKIECEIVTSDSMNHAWNYIKINNKWYHVDVTWDDSMINNEVDYFGQVLHNYFLLSDESMKSKNHYDWNTNGLPKADDKTYDNNFWNEAESGIFKINNDWFYIDREEKYPYYYDGSFCRTLAYIKKYNFKTNETEIIYRIFSTWFVWTENKEEDRYYSWNFAKLAVNNDLLFFNTADKIYSIDIYGENLTEIYSTINNEGYIYGLTIYDNSLKYVLKYYYYDTGVFETEELIK